MDALTPAIYERLVGDVTLATLLSTYRDAPAVFTADAPGDASLPYIVTTGSVSDSAFDTKTVQGRQVWRDVRCYDKADGSAALVEQIAERVRVLLHRQPLVIDGFQVFVAQCAGPVVMDEPGAYGRVVTVQMLMMEG